jgi:Fe-S cluster assembly ATP-binding protein
MLSIKDLQVSINDKVILSHFNLEVKEGEIHAIMGPNGTGKSTLASVIAGRELFHVDSGEITYRGKDLFDLAPEVRAREGIFLGFQYPVEIPGVSMANFMRTAMNEKRKHFGMEPMSGAEFLKIMEEKKKLVDIQSKLTNRAVNEGFSGGKKRKMRYFRWLCWNPNWPYWTKQTQAWILMR